MIDVVVYMHFSYAKNTHFLSDNDSVFSYKIELQLHSFEAGFVKKYFSTNLLP
jgi:hypothetical protein